MVQLCRIHHASGADSTCWKPGWFLDMGDHHEQHATQIICWDFWIKVHLSDQNIFNQKWLFVGDVRILRSHCSFKPRGRKMFVDFCLGASCRKTLGDDGRGRQRYIRWRGSIPLIPNHMCIPYKASYSSQYVDIKWLKVQYTTSGRNYLLPLKFACIINLHPPFHPQPPEHNLGTNGRLALAALRPFASGGAMHGVNMRWPSWCQKHT